MQFTLLSAAAMLFTLVSGVAIPVEVAAAAPAELETRQGCKPWTFTCVDPSRIRIVRLPELSPSSTNSSL